MITHRRMRHLSETRHILHIANCTILSFRMGRDMAYSARTRQIVETSKYNPEAKASPAVAAEHGRVQKHLVWFMARRVSLASCVLCLVIFPPL